MKEPTLGEYVVWLDLPAAKRCGILVYKGPVCEGLPEYDSLCWVSEVEYRAICEGHGRIRFSSVPGGVIVRVDRFHPETGEPLVPWYYAPKKVDAETPGNRIR